MKCPKCDGKGMVDYPMYADDEHKWQYCVARMKKCDMCNGTGEVQMTNEEWLHTLNTEQLAKWLSNHVKFVYDCGLREVLPKTMYEEDWEWWLKQPCNS